MRDSTMESAIAQTVDLQQRSSVKAMILVVHSDPEQLTQLCVMLEKKGLDARGFIAVDEALEAMSGSRAPALVITELCMPWIDGWQFGRLMRSSEYSALNQVPMLVLCAALAGEEPQRVATALGVYAFLAEPFDSAAFVRKVLGILRAQITPAAPLRALIVYPGKHQASLLSNAFAAAGYTTDTAQTVRAANVAIDRTVYDVAVIDHHLPDGTGDMLLERFRDNRPECACIMMTDEPAPVLSLDWMKMGAAAFVCKPIEPACLLKLCAQTHKERSLMRTEYLQKQSVSAHKASQNKFSALAAALNEAIIILDMGGAISFWSAAAVRMFGYKPEDALGRALDDLIAPQSCHAEYQEAFPLFNKTDDDKDFARSFTLQARCRDGREIAIELSRSMAEVSYDCHTFVTVRDKTAGNVTEKSLADSTFNIGSILSSINTAVLSYSIKQNCYLYVNPAAEKIYGRQKATFAQKKFTPVDFIHPDDAGILQTIKNQLAASGSAQEECRIVRPDGKAVWVSAYLKVVRDAGGKPDRIDKVITDITERRHRELTLRKHCEQITGILNAVDDVIITASSKDSSIIYISPSFERLFGTKARTHLHGIQLLEEVVHPDDTNILQDHRVQLSREGFAEHALRAIKHNGDVAWFRLYSKAILGDTGEPEATQHILNDITKFKNGEKEPENVPEEPVQEQNNENMAARLAGGVSHDFNNILSVIIGHADLALQNLTPGQPLYANIRTIRSKAESAANRARKLLAFAGKQAIAPRELDINATVESTLTMLRGLVGEHIRIDWQPGKNPGRVIIDPAQVKQVLSELCSNAKNAIVEQGTITIATGSASISEDMCAQKPGFSPGEFITLQVTDNGKGIDGTTLSKIFEPYCFIHDMDKNTGLGLPAVQGIVHQNKGFIHIASEPGSGTCITIYLPRNDAEEPAGPEGGEQAPPVPRHTATIVLVEYEPDNLELYAAMLESLGCTVLCAATAEECLRLATSHDGRIDLLITGVVLPDINGRELADAFLAKRPKTQCLFMSGYPSNVIARQGMLDPGSNFIEKPFSLQDFTATVTQLLNRCEVHAG